MKNIKMHIVFKMSILRGYYMATKVFNKLIESNPSIGCAISTIVAEYDIHAAHASALYFIKGPELYNKLMKMDKLSRNTQIGLMMRDDPHLHEKIAALILKWFNNFCQVNNINESNFISSTRDSLLLLNKKPIKTSFENGIVEFRNKEGEYTSYIRVKNMEILYDGMSNNMRIKGVSSEYVEGNQSFVKLFRQLLALVELSKNVPMNQVLKKANLIRNKYIDSKDPSLYASIMDANKYVYIVDGERVISDTILSNKNAVLVKSDNYINFFLPVMKICFKAH